MSIAAGLPNNIHSLSIADLKACGVARVSLPVIALFLGDPRIRRTLLALRDSEDLATIVQEQLLCSPEELSAPSGDRWSWHA